MVKQRRYQSFTNKSETNSSFHDTRSTNLAGSTRDITKNNTTGKDIIHQLNEIDWKSNSSGIEIPGYLLCPRCNNIYSTEKNDPICLPCGHTYCRPCIYLMRFSLLSGFCPVDHKEFYCIDEFLPVNYSLTSIPSFSNRTCSIHDLPLIGFCLDDSCFLCGKCIFKHKPHNFIELFTDQSDKVVEENLNNLKYNESKLKELLRTWEYYINALLEAKEKVAETINLHIERLHKVEEELRLEIHNHTERIIKDILHSKDVINVESTDTAKEVVECIKYHVLSVERLCQNYSCMNIYEQLSIRIGKLKDFADPISIASDSILGKYKNKLKYRQIILKDVS